MSVTHWLFALFALLMLVKHGQRGLRFLAPGRGESRRPFAVSFVTLLLALLILAGAVHIALRSH